MARYPYISELPEPTNTWRYVDEWLQLSQEDIDRIGSVRGTMHDRIRECAETRAAEDLISKMNTEAGRGYQSTTRWLVRGLVVLIGSLTFGRGFYLLASMILPKNFVWVVTFFGGLTISAYVDTLATQTLTNQEKSRILHKHRQQFKVNQHQAQTTETELTETFYNGQTGLVERVEKGHGIWQLPLAAIVACGLSLAEFVITFYVLEDALAALAADLLLTELLPFVTVMPTYVKVTISALPVVTTWAASLLQSRYFERPDYLGDLITQYERHIIPNIDLSDEAFDDWAYHRSYQDGRIHAHVLHVLGYSAPHLKNLTMAYGAYEVSYREHRLRQLQQAYKQDVQALYTRYQDDVIALPARADLPPLLTIDRSDLEVVEQEERRQYLRRAWVNEEKPRLLARFQADLTMLKADYDEEIKRQAEKWKAGKAEYEAGCRQWQQLNKYKHDSRKNDAA